MPETEPRAERSVRVEQYRLRPRKLAVARIEDLTPYLRRFTLAGDDLEPGFPYQRFTANDHVKLFFPDDSGRLVMPQIVEDRLSLRPGGPRPIYRDYTVRSVDVARRELVIDFVRHDHGPAGRWALSARVGDQLGVLGPRGSHHYPDDFGWYLIAGDETALPAIGRWVEDLAAADRPATVVVAISGPDGELALGDHDGIEVRWVPRDPARPDAFEAQVRSVPLPDHEDYFVWIAGEAGEIRPIRRYFRREVGLDPARLDIDGYWKRGVSNLDHHVADEDD